MGGLQTVCATHQSPLIVASDIVCGKRRFQWLLPSEAHHNRSQYALTEISVQTSALQDVIHDFFSKGCLADFSDHQRVAQTNVRQLLSKGFGSKRLPKSLDWNRTSKDFLSWLSHLKLFAYIDTIPDTEKKALLLLQRNLLPRASNTHPLNRLMFITWAFGDWRTFASEYTVTTNLVVDTPPGCKPRSQDPNYEKRQKAIELLTSGKSATSVAIDVKVDTQTVICWGRAAGCDIKQRPRRDKTADIAFAKCLLYDGTEKPEIEAKTDLSRATINRLLRCDVDLSERWTSERSRRDLEMKRSQWTELRHLNPTYSTQQIRLINNPLYAWLYRNDREWLLDQTLSTNIGKSGNNSSLNWDERDFEYAGLVQEATLSLSISSPDLRITRAQILEQVPDLRKKLKHLNRLPRTAKALAFALSNKVHDRDSLQMNLQSEPPEETR